MQILLKENYKKEEVVFLIKADLSTTIHAVDKSAFVIC